MRDGAAAVGVGFHRVGKCTGRGTDFEIRRRGVREWSVGWRRIKHGGELPRR